jgi:Uma2 family endonuclease
MGAALALAKITPEEYLQFERQSETKHEYFDGEIFAMAGASRRHCKISANLMRIIGNKLYKTKCSVYANDFRVKIKETGLYTYPDLIVTCGKEILEDQVKDTLLNPLIIIEILSPSTEKYDRGKKFAHYRQIENLQNYVLISQEEPNIEVFQRQPNEQWLFSEKNGLENSIEIPAIDYLLPLVEVYDKIDFNDALELR